MSLSEEAFRAKYCSAPPAADGERVLSDILAELGLTTDDAMQAGLLTDLFPSSSADAHRTMPTELGFQYLRGAGVDEYIVLANCDGPVVELLRAHKAKYFDAPGVRTGERPLADVLRRHGLELQDVRLVGLIADRLPSSSTDARRFVVTLVGSTYLRVGPGVDRFIILCDRLADVEELLKAYSDAQ